MEVVIVDEHTDAGRLAAGAIARLVAARPDAALGLATGSSPLPVYEELRRLHVAGELDLSQVRGFLLDEYLGLEPGHPQSYRASIMRVFATPLGIADDRIHGPDVHDPDGVEALCRRYEELLASVGGVDIQLLGIGSDGHIGFNEPISSLGSRTRIKTLTDATRTDNARFFEGGLDAVPTHVITQGIGTILEAAHVILLAFGTAKAPAIAAAVEGPITAKVPASALQLHPHVTVVVDEAAASALTLAGYYRSTYANKPDWQSI